MSAAPVGVAESVAVESALPSVVVAPFAASDVTDASAAVVVASAVWLALTAVVVLVEKALALALFRVLVGFCENKK